MFWNQVINKNIMNNIKEIGYIENHKECHKKINIIQLGNLIKNSNFKNPQRGRIYSINGIAPSINTCQGGQLEPKILVKKKKMNDYK